MLNGREKSFERLTLSMLLAIAETEEAPIVVALVRQIERDSRMIAELSSELDRLDPIDPRD